MKRKYAAVLMTSITAAAVLFVGCGAPVASAEEPVNVEGEAIAGGMQSVEPGQAGGEAESQAGGNDGGKAGSQGGGSGGQEAERQGGGSGGQEAESQGGGSGGLEAGSQAGGSGGQEAGSQAGGSGGQEAGSQAGENGGQEAGSQNGGAPENGSHPDLLSRKTHTSLFTDMAIQGKVVELTEGGCVIDPPQVSEGSNGTIMVGGSGGEENYVTASFDSDCRVYRSTYNEADGSVSLEECEISDITAGDNVLLYGTLSGKSIAVSDVVISG